MGRQKIHRADMTCSQCGQSFTPSSKQYHRVKGGYRPFCSTACSRKAQGERLSKPPTPQQLKLLLHLYAEGTLLKEISHRTGIDTSTISKIAKSHGLKPRFEYKPHRTKTVGDKGSWYLILEIKDRTGRVNHHKKTHLARCDYCGDSRWYAIDTLGKVKSCGCKRSEFAGAALKDHGEAGGRGKKSSPEYSAWRNFKAKMRRERERETNPTMTNQQASPYDPRWDNYSNFLADVGRRPHPDYCFTRKNDEGGYFKDNVEWQLRSQLAVYNKPEKPEDYIHPRTEPEFAPGILKRIGKASPLIG